MVESGRKKGLLLGAVRRGAVVLALVGLPACCGGWIGRDAKGSLQGRHSVRIYFNTVTPRRCLPAGSIFTGAQGRLKPAPTAYLKALLYTVRVAALHRSDTGGQVKQAAAGTPLQV